MEKLKPFILETVNYLRDFPCIYEKSTSSSRALEGLKGIELAHKGTLKNEIHIRENGLQFIVNLQKASQKTGFFLDQRNMRQKVKSMAQNRRCLNCFGFTGAFSVYALVGGAKKVDTLDISESALDLAKKNIAINGFDASIHSCIKEDAFDFLRNAPLDYDLIILDPPAFAKTKKDIVAACRGYKEINRLCIQKMPKNSYLITASCSHHVDEGLFQQVLFQASSEAKRKVRILGRHLLAEDHPINIFHPEGEYLKSFLLYIE